MAEVIELSRKQRVVLRLIRKFREDWLRSPSVEIIAVRLGVDESTVREHLYAAYRKNWLVSPTPDGMTEKTPIPR